MMRYYYFPGCSMAATAKGSQQSIDAVTRKIGMDPVSYTHLSESRATWLSFGLTTPRRWPTW